MTKSFLGWMKEEKDRSSVFRQPLDEISLLTNFDGNNVWTNFNEQTFTPPKEVQSDCSRRNRVGAVLKSLFRSRRSTPPEFSGVSKRNLQNNY